MMKTKRRLEGWLTVQIAKDPGRIVLAAILLFNIVFFFVAALVISHLHLAGTEEMGFLEAAFCTVTMILDAGCIQFVIADIGQAGVIAAVICLVIVLIGMISFTGAVIGYITNYISNFIEHANAVSNKLKISDHVVILNWNTRASEIVNDLMYSGEKQKVVVLVSSRKSEIEKEIQERLSDTVARENMEISESVKDRGFFARAVYCWRNRFANHLTVIVKEGDVFSSKQLHDISLEYARTVIILGSDINNTICKFEVRERLEEAGRGNAQTIKTLMQVADITAAEYSSDNQKIIVEITDDWTEDLVDKIIKSKQVAGKCNIVPVRVNKILGQILSQFSLMPELNLVYRVLFSNKGAAFFSEQGTWREDTQFISEYMASHRHAIPLTVMESSGQPHEYYAALSEKDIGRQSEIRRSDYKVSLNKNYWIEPKNVVILGHNSKCRDIMQGFAAFRNEWNYRDGHADILSIVVIDDPDYLEKVNYYREYPFVTKTVPASIYDRDIICSTIDEFISTSEEDTSVLILSDDSALKEDIDSNALAGLVCVQDIINDKLAADPDFDVGRIDVIVEIIDPKHHDIVSSYSVNNVVISNRYISKMITQIGQKEALYDFYTDILTYDSGDSDIFESKEIYTKKVSSLFDELPGKCRADEFIRAVYEASTDPSLPPEKQNPTLALGYVKPGGKVIFFAGDQSSEEVDIDSRDKLIVFSRH